ncbi:redoxin family protein [Globicatella sanguinis]|uniref:redoxin family protein n=1 Tax=Globicatella sanguinis TaxID=13076 RepID=UPI000AEF47A4|nr:redoxin family protein [Globicatella sanguinis]
MNKRLLFGLVAMSVVLSACEPGNQANNEGMNDSETTKMETKMDQMESTNMMDDESNDMDEMESESMDDDMGEMESEAMMDDASDEMGETESEAMMDNTSDNMGEMESMMDSVTDKMDGTESDKKDDNMTKSESKDMMDNASDNMDEKKSEEMDDNMTKTESTKKDDNMTSEKMNQGELAPDFNLPDIDGNMYKLSDQKGKKVYIKYWASWCPICLAGLSEIDELSKTSGDYEIVTVVSPGHNGEKNKEDFIKWFKSLNYKNIKVLVDESGKFIEDYGIRSTPTNVIVGSDGVLVKVAPGQLNKETLDQIYKEVQ